MDNIMQLHVAENPQILVFKANIKSIKNKLFIFSFPVKCLEKSYYSFIRVYLSSLTTPLSHVLHVSMTANTFEPEQADWHVFITFSSPISFQSEYKHTINHHKLQKTSPVYKLCSFFPAEGCSMDRSCCAASAQSKSRNDNPHPSHLSTRRMLDVSSWHGTFLERLHAQIRYWE